MVEDLKIAQRDLLAKIAQCESLKDAYLAGGTALTLKLGHRLSADFDFFIETPLHGEKMVEDLSRHLTVEAAQMAPETLHVKLDGIPVSFFEYHYRLLEKEKCLGITLASLKDIALMKIMAIQQRGLRKDFIDLFAILRTGITLANLFSILPEKFPNIRFDKISLLKALCYFEDASDDVPLLTKDINWQEVKLFFKAEVHKNRALER